MMAALKTNDGSFSIEDVDEPPLPADAGVAYCITSLITHRFPPDQTKEALASFRTSFRTKKRHLPLSA